MRGIYIHIPFCVQKCFYCDFPSFTKLDFLHEDYTEAVIREIGTYDKIEVDTIYFGGGTPSIVDEKYILRILDAIRSHFNVDKNAEITIEVNPGTVSEKKLRSLFMGGFNRISIGSQSFIDSELSALGRIHKAKDIKIAYDYALKAGFKNISLDIIFGLPNQSLSSFLYSLDEIINLSPSHISAYSLIIEEGTPFYNMDLNLPDEDTEREMYHILIDRLKKHGYKHYEISNFAKSGYESRHNIKYWLMEEYIGLGAGAHSFFNGERYSNKADVPSYIKGEGQKIEKVILTGDEYNKERFWLGLRLIDGIIYKGEFKEKTKELIDKGLLELKDNYLRLTPHALDIANAVFMEYV